MRKNLGLSYLILSLATVVWAGAPIAKNGVVLTSNPEFVEDCEYVGEVRAGSSWGGLTMKKVAEKKTYKKLSKRAAEAGMDIVLIHDSKVGFGGSRAQATGYICPAIAEFDSTGIVQTYRFPTGSTQGIENHPSETSFRIYRHGPPGWLLTNRGWVQTETAQSVCGDAQIPVD